jgi:hypothetical protein
LIKIVETTRRRGLPLRAKERGKRGERREKREERREKREERREKREEKREERRKKRREKREKWGPSDPPRLDYRYLRRVGTSDTGARSRD